MDSDRIIMDGLFNHVPEEQERCGWCDDRYHRTADCPTQENLIAKAKQREFDNLMAWIAQVVVNIDSGFQTIAAGSAAHKAMSKLCMLVSEGEVGILDGTRTTTTTSRTKERKSQL